MSKLYVKVTPAFTIKEATRLMQEKQQNCVLVVDNEDFLEGIVTLGDIRRKGFEPSENSHSTGGNSSPLDVCQIPFFLSLLCTLAAHASIGNFAGKFFSRLIMPHSRVSVPW
jgi:hypothetical protein